MALKRPLHAIDSPDSDLYCESSTTTSNNTFQKHPFPQTFTCDQPPTCHVHPVAFHNLSSYEAHHQIYHTYSCIECPATFPSERFLSLHITEHHDPFSILRKERGYSIYRCLVKECNILSKDPLERRAHMINHHGFPKEYTFSVISKGIGEGQTSFLQRW